MSGPRNYGADTGKPTPPVEHQFKPGNAGRPKGARNKLGEAFIQALHDDFAEHGVAAIATVRAEKPDQYLKVIASLMPKEMTLNFTDDYSETTDDELIERIRELDAAIAPFLASREAATGSDSEGEAGSRLTARVH
jgi:hypothetical protein